MVVGAPMDRSLFEDSAIQIGDGDARSGTRDFNPGRHQGFRPQSKDQGASADLGVVLALGLAEQPVTEHAVDNECHGARGESGDSYDIGP